MEFRPLHDRVVVKRIDPEEKSAGGTISRTPPRKNRRKAKSPLIPIDLKFGERVLFGK